MRGGAVALLVGSALADLFTERLALALSPP
jgi:hypothetical protein